MKQNSERSYAVGVQKFDWIRKHGAAYMDKTKYVWQMVSSSSPFYFLSRPRRFGKSLLVDTLRCYFEGRKELFEGLYIYDKETEWRIDIEQLTETMNKRYSRWGIHYTYDDVVSKLKEMYDGYHFSKDMTDIYCPWSLINTFAMGDIQNFWFSTGTPTMLISVMRQHNVSIQQLEGRPYSLRRFDAPTERISDPIPVLYQSGYLTLKDYNPVENEFVLGFPNQEVREGFAHSLYKYYMEDYVGSEDALGNAFKRLSRKEITVEQFVECIRRWYAGIPYNIMDKNQNGRSSECHPSLLEDGRVVTDEGKANGRSSECHPSLLEDGRVVTDEGKANEQLYQSLIYAALIGFGADVQAEEQTSDGRMDIVLKMPDAVYIIELKYGKTAEEAVEQIMSKDYAVRFAHDSRPIVAVGMNISQDRRTIDGYKIINIEK